VFGVGAGLTLDEFALWVRLEDVYWAEEGRTSLDAVVIAALLGGLIVLGFAPFDSADGSPGTSLLVAVTIDVLLCAPGSDKLARSQARFGRAKARHRRVFDLIGGRPSAEGALENERSG
jgi:hypothetical protein